LQALWPPIEPHGPLALVSSAIGMVQAGVRLHFGLDETDTGVSVTFWVPVVAVLLIARDRWGPTQGR